MRRPDRDSMPMDDEKVWRTEFAKPKMESALKPRR
jgi:hypothetical protein